MSRATRATRIQARRVLFVAMVLNATVAFLKIVCGRSTHLAAVEADGYHSLSDGLGSLLALIGLTVALSRTSLRPSDGQDQASKIEGWMSVGMGLLLMGVGGCLFVGVCVRGLVEPHELAFRDIEVGPAAFVVLAVTLGINLGIAHYQAREGRRLHNALLLADAQHTRADCYVTLGVLASTIFAACGVPQLDAIATVLVALLVVKAGVEVASENLQGLREPSEVSET